MKNYLQEGSTLPITASRAVLAGAMISAGMLAGVAVHDAATGTAVEIETKGCFSIAKTTGQAWAVGDPIYLITATGICTTAKTGNLFVGVAIEAAASADTTGSIRLNGAAPAALAT